MSDREKYIHKRLMELALIAENRELEIIEQEEERRLINELETNYGGK